MAKSTVKSQPKSKRQTPLAYARAKPTDLARVRGVCLDIDDTLSTEGKLTSKAYDALWRLKQAGFFVVPITGRPAGWCDQIVRFWPVDAVIGENGGFSFFMKASDSGRMRRERLDTLPHDQIRAVQSRLQGLRVAVKSRFPFAEWASDQGYREYDLAIDICEDVPTWKPSDVDALLALCHAQGAHAKLSSIHVNAWFGEYDKASGFKHWLSAGAPGLGSSNGGRVRSASKVRVPEWNEWLFIGDSPNDEPLFKVFEQSVGVANLKRYLPTLTHPPTYLTRAPSGAGFCEMADRLISAKRRQRTQR